MSKAWPLVPLGTVLSSISRAEKVQAEKAYRILGARWYAKGLFIKDIEDGVGIKAPWVYRVEKGDFVYNRLFALKGSFAVVDDVCDQCYVSNEFPCFSVDPTRLDAQFLWHYFSRETAWAESLGLSSGATPTSRNRLKVENLLSKKIPVPPLGEQRRLVARIEALAGKIEETKKLRQESMSLAKGFISSLHLHLSEGSKRKMEEILVIDESREEVQLDQEYPQVGVKGFGEGLFARETLDASQTTYKAFNRLYDGAVVLSQVKGWEGAIAVCRSDLAGKYVSPEYRTFRCIPGAAIPEYLASLFATPWFWTQLKYMTRGVGARRERIRPEQFLKLEIPMPTVERQKEAAQTISRLRDIEQLREETAAELDALLPAILDRAFKGEL